MEAVAWALSSEEAPAGCEDASACLEGLSSWELRSGSIWLKVPDFTRMMAANRAAQAMPDTKDMTIPTAGLCSVLRLGEELPCQGEVPEPLLPRGAV